MKATKKSNSERKHKASAKSNSAKSESKSKLSAQAIKSASAQASKQASESKEAKKLNARFRSGSMRALIRSLLERKSGASKQELCDAVQKQFKTDISGHLNSKLATMRARFNVEALPDGKLHISSAKPNVLA